MLRCRTSRHVTNVICDLSNVFFKVSGILITHSSRYSPEVFIIIYVESFVHIYQSTVTMCNKEYSPLGPQILSH